MADTAFQREERFIVIKRKHLTPEIENDIRVYLAIKDIAPVECVVVESDWPEYETVWGMIERRVTGKIECKYPVHGSVTHGRDGTDLCDFCGQPADVAPQPDPRDADQCQTVRCEKHRNDLYDKVMSQQTDIGVLRAEIERLKALAGQLADCLSLELGNLANEDENEDADLHLTLGADYAKQVIAARLRIRQARTALANSEGRANG